MNACCTQGRPHVDGVTPNDGQTHWLKMSNAGAWIRYGDGTIRFEPNEERVDWGPAIAATQSFIAQIEAELRELEGSP